MTSAAANLNLETCDTATDEIVPKRNASSLTIFFCRSGQFSKNRKMFTPSFIAPCINFANKTLQNR
jgi:hypothetical protein